MTHSPAEKIEAMRKANKSHNWSMAKQLALCFGTAAAMGALSLSGEYDRREVTEAERTEAMQSCMVDFAARQIRQQTSLARNGAIVVIDGGNPAVEECAAARLDEGEPTARRNSGAMFGSLFGGLSLIVGGGWFFSARKRRAALDEALRAPTPRP
jgi:hypothetical protein